MRTFWWAKKMRVHAHAQDLCQGARHPSVSRRGTRSQNSADFSDREGPSSPAHGRGVMNETFRTNTVPGHGFNLCACPPSPTGTRAGIFHRAPMQLKEPSLGGKFNQMISGQMHERSRLSKATPNNGFQPNAIEGFAFRRQFRTKTSAKSSQRSRLSKAFSSKGPQPTALKGNLPVTCTAAKRPFRRYFA